MSAWYSCGAHPVLSVCVVCSSVFFCSCVLCWLELAAGCWSFEGDSTVPFLCFTLPLCFFLWFVLPVFARSSPSLSTGFFLSSPPLVFLFFRSFPSCICSFIPFSLYWFFFPILSPSPSFVAFLWLLYSLRMPSVRASWGRGIAAGRRGP